MWSICLEQLETSTHLGTLVCYDPLYIVCGTKKGDYRTINCYELYINWVIHRINKMSSILYITKIYILLHINFIQSHCESSWYQNLKIKIKYILHRLSFLLIKRCIYNTAALCLLQTGKCVNSISSKQYSCTISKLFFLKINEQGL